MIEDLLAGNHDAAGRAVCASLPGEWPNEDDLWLLDLRLRQMNEDPAIAPWLLRAIVRSEDDRFIGHIGFHGPPESGVVEVGYMILPGYRRHGYAIEAIEAMFSWANREHGVDRFRASVGPSNEPSLALINKLGFIQTGTQWDERDGEELVFELQLFDPGLGPDPHD